MDNASSPSLSAMRTAAARDRVAGELRSAAPGLGPRPDAGRAELIGDRLDPVPLAVRLLGDLGLLSGLGRQLGLQLLLRIGRTPR